MVAIEVWQGILDADGCGQGPVGKWTRFGRDYWAQMVMVEDRQEILDMAIRYGGRKGKGKRRKGGEGQGISEKE